MVFGCIAKSITDHDIKQLLRILFKALESFSDINLIEAIVMCLTRLQPLLRPESPIHKALFWVSISILQFDEMSLYASGLALLEQNLFTLENQRTFEEESLDSVMLKTREPLKWYFNQLDHSVGLTFTNNFHFALVGHLIKGFRHPNQVTVSRTTRILSMCLDIVAKTQQKDKFEVTPQNIAYLAGLVSVSEEVRSRCHVRHVFSDMMPDSPTFDSFVVDTHLNLNQQNSNNSSTNQQTSTASGTTTTGRLPSSPNEEVAGSSPTPSQATTVTVNSGRQKSLEQLDSLAVNEVKSMQKLPAQASISTGFGTNLQVTPGVKLEKRSNSVTCCVPSAAADNEAEWQMSPGISGKPENVADQASASARPSVSNENNILLDPEILTDHVTQVEKNYYFCHLLICHAICKLG